MKKKQWIIVAALVLAAILFAPVPKGVYKDGGTREYAALTYKIVDWNRLTADGLYDVTRIYLLPDNFRSVDTLWERELEERANKLVAQVVFATEQEALLESVEDGSRYRVRLPEAAVDPGQVLELWYTGPLLYSDPPVITNILSWKQAADCRPLEYGGLWIEKTTSEEMVETLVGDFVITEIWGNCFFAQSVIGAPYVYKFNGALSGDWCPGDQVALTYRNIRYDDEQMRIEAEYTAIEISTFSPNPIMAYKPVIYLYPEEATGVSVKLKLAGELTCTYPRYGNGWTVTAEPDGTLTDPAGQTYKYLYWEGQLEAQWDWSRGFCVKGTDTAAFLEDALEKLGLSREEANEFIVYWLPMMEGNPYNIIAFQQDAYTDAAGLEIVPAPDTLIRIFMTWKPSAVFVETEPQELSAPERSGFTVVEWGGGKVG